MSSVWDDYDDDNWSQTKAVDSKSEWDAANAQSRQPIISSLAYKPEVKILKRDIEPKMYTSPGKNSVSQLSKEDRQRKYDEARARLFGIDGQERTFP